MESYSAGNSPCIEAKGQLVQRDSSMGYGRKKQVFPRARWTIDDDPGDRRDRIPQTFARMPPARRKFRHAFLHHVAHGGQETGDGGKIPGAAFVFVREKIGLFFGFGATAGTAVDEGCRMGPRPEEEQPQPGRSQKSFVGGDAEEIAGKGSEIDRDLTRGLGRVNTDEGPRRKPGCKLSHLAEGEEGAGYVACGSEKEKLRGGCSVSPGTISYPAFRGEPQGKTRTLHCKSFPKACKGRITALCSMLEIAMESPFARRRVESD